jgi:hypothetical protein
MISISKEQVETGNLGEISSEPIPGSHATSSIRNNHGLMSHRIVASSILSRIRLDLGLFATICSTILAPVPISTRCALNCRAPVRNHFPAQPEHSQLERSRPY